MNEFYVYQHTHNSVPFYVGKGRRKRAWYRHGRNKKWNEFTSKNPDWCVEIVFDNLSESDAHQKEIDLIKRIGKENLCNITDGGDGISGFKFSPDQIKKLSISHIGVSAGERHPLYGTSRPKHTKEKISKSLIGNKNRGTNPLSLEARSSISEKMKGRFSGMKHHLSDKTIRRFIHPDFGVFVGTQFELREKHGLCQANISAVCRGVRKRCKGWELA